MFRGAKTKCEELLPTSLQKYMILFMSPSKCLIFEGKTTTIINSVANPGLVSKA